jgi:DNA-binding XRE family transcriptional regulator
MFDAKGLTLHCSVDDRFAIASSAIESYNQKGYTVLVTRDWWRAAALKKARARKNMTQAALAKKVGVHQVTIARLESGIRRPSMRLLHRLARALEVDVAALLGIG